MHAKPSKPAVSDLLHPVAFQAVLAALSLFCFITCMLAPCRPALSDLLHLVALQAVLAALSLFCFITCVLASCAPTAYSDTMPKRVVLQHHNRHDAAGTILATR